MDNGLRATLLPMLSQGDKDWIKGTFATKDDLGAFATKVDFQALKTDIEGITTNVAVLAADMSFVKTEVVRMRERAEHIEILADRMVTSADRLACRFQSIEQENKMGARTLRRHSVNIEELAKATSTKISS